MRSSLFEQGHQEVQATERFSQQNSQMLRVALGEDVLAVKGSMVAFQGEISFTHEAGYLFQVELTGDALSVNGRNLLAFDAGLQWDIHRTKGAGIMAGGLFNTTLTGHGTVALCTVGQPVLLDCRQQPTYVDVQACVAWSANLVPQVVNSMKMSSLVRGGSGEAFQYAFHGDGFVVVQPYEWKPPSSGTSSS